MSIPRRKLEVPEIPGYHQYWFREDNVERAIQAGYEFVERNETTLHQRNVSADVGVSGNTDLGNHVSLICDKTEAGMPQRAYLMKIKNEWYDEDRKALEQEHMKIMNSIFDQKQILGTEQVSKEDRDQMYISQGKISQTVMQRKRPKV